MNLPRIFFIASFLFVLIACGEDPVSSKNGNYSSGNEPSSAPTQGVPYEVKCNEPLPVFTLGKNSKPSEQQVTKLCSCIWSNLKGWEREVSEKISKGMEAEISALHIKAFPPRFGNALRACGGMDL